MSQHRTGTRSSRRKRGFFHRTGIVFPAAGIAAVAVAAVALAAYLLSPGTPNASGADTALEAIPHSNTIALLEAKRQQLIDMNAAAHTLAVAAKPKLVSPAQVIAAANAASGSGSSSSSGGGSSSSGGGTVVTGPPPSPGTAEAIAYRLIPDYGLSQSQWGCLYNLWMRESGWNYTAENASGATGIPQALPAIKMASAGPDYLTNPETQIKWGLGYIKSTYGTLCTAWDFELANGYY